MLNIIATMEFWLLIIIHLMSLQNYFEEFDDNKVYVIKNKINSGYAGGNNFGAKYIESFSRVQIHCYH